MKNTTNSKLSTQLALIDGTRDFAKNIMNIAHGGLADDNSTYRVFPEYEWWDDGYGFQKWIRKTWPEWPQTITTNNISVGYNNTYNVQSSEKDGLYTVTVDMPGAKKSDVKIVTKKSRAEFSWKRGTSSHSTSAWIPDHVDHLSAKAKLEDGVLTIHFQIVPEARERVVEVE